MPGLTRSGSAQPARPTRVGVLRRLGSNDDGAVAVIVAIMMVVVLGMAALVIDIGGISSRKGMLQNAADAAAMAVAQACADQGSVTACSMTSAQATSLASRIAVKNVNDGQVTVAPVTFPTAYTVTVAVSGTQKDFFASVFGTTRSAVTATATAQWVPTATPIPLAFNACEFPAPSDQKVLMRTDPLALFQGSCGLLTGVVNAVVPSWITANVTDQCTLDMNAVPVVIGVVTQLIPSACVAELQTLLGHRILLPVYEHPLTNVTLQCVVGGLLGSLLIGQASNSDCAIEKYAVVDLTGYDFASVNADLYVNLLNLAQVVAGVQIGQANMPGTPNCGQINLQLGSLVGSLVGMPLCQGIQGSFRGFVSKDDAASMQTGDVKLIA